MKPLLIDGYKFDLRIYVLVSSFNPLEAFIYREGFARFGSSIFSTLPEDKDDERIHLTNSSIQQKYWNDFKPDHPVKNAGSHGDGNKVSLTWLWMFLEKRKYSTKVMWKSICDVCIKTLLCVEDEISYQPNAFEVYGEKLHPIFLCFPPKNSSTHPTESCSQLQSSLNVLSFKVLT